MAVQEHFQVLLDDCDADLVRLYFECRHVRVETAFKDRHFLIYEMKDDEPRVIDRLIINDFDCNEEFGCSTEITSCNLNQTITVGYEPQQLFDYPVVVWLPLHGKIRWSAWPSDPKRGSLGFPIAVRTISRLHLRERGVVYCETGTAYRQEFHDKTSN